MIDSLLKCDLFKNCNAMQIQVFLDEIPYSTKEYKKGQIIAVEGDPCERIGIVINGSIIMQNIMNNGNSSIIGRFGPGKLFGEVLVFGNQNTYPASVIAESDSEVFYFNNKDFMYLLRRNDKLFQNILSLLTNRIFYLNSRIKLMNQHCLRNKICFYLYNQFKQNGKEKIQLKMSKQQFAEYIGVQRPSLSRELINMRDEGLIEFDRKTITILDIPALESFID